MPIPGIGSHCILCYITEKCRIKQLFPLQCPAGVIFFQCSTSGWRHFSCHFPPVLQCNSFFLSPPFFPRQLQYVAVWIVCYYPAGDNIITTYLLSRVCKEWCCLGPQWSNNLTQGSRITHSWLGEVKHYQLERGVNKREVPTLTLSLSPLPRSLSRGDRRGHTSSAPNGGCYSPHALVEIYVWLKCGMIWDRIGGCGRVVCMTVCHFR